MKIVKVEGLTHEGFLPYGSYGQMLNPAAEGFAGPARVFFRDILQQDMGCASTVSYSTCRVEPRELLITHIENHSRTAEGILPLDNDVIMHVLTATRPGVEVLTDRVRTFRIPKGTLVVLRAGVWHHAPYTVDDKPANVLIVLPERTYANDCTVVALNEDQWVGIVL